MKPQLIVVGSARLHRTYFLSRAPSRHIHWCSKIDVGADPIVYSASRDRTSCSSNARPEALPTLLGFREVARPFTPGTHKRAVSPSAVSRELVVGHPRRPLSHSVGLHAGRRKPKWERRVGSDPIASRRVVACCCVALCRVVRSRTVSLFLSLALSHSYSRTPLFYKHDSIPVRVTSLTPGYPRYVVTRHVAKPIAGRRVTKKEDPRGGEEPPRPSSNNTNNTGDKQETEREVKKTLARTLSSHSLFLRSVVSVSFDVPGTTRNERIDRDRTDG